jgi:hypothetical protein
MAKATPLYSSFNGGEVSPELEGRVDIAKYHSSLYRCENMIPMIQGPARRRSGTRFVKEVRDSTKPPFLSKFIFNVRQSFVLEWGDHYVRFYTNHGIVLDGSGNVYEVATPYAYADLTDVDGLFTLRFAQIADVVYVTNTLSTYPTQKLSRYGNANWTLAPVVFSGGPFKPLNPLDSPVMYASGQTGSVTVTVNIAAVIGSVGSDGGGNFLMLTRPLAAIPPAGTVIQDLTNEQASTPHTIATGSTVSKLYLTVAGPKFTTGGTIVINMGAAVPVFKAAHIGALLYLETHDIHRVKPWEVGKAYKLGHLAQYNGVTYKCFDAGTSGTVPPTQLFGDAYDGSHNTSAGWTYQDAGYGWGVITAVASDGQSCTVEVGDPTAIDPPIQYPIGVTADVDWTNDAVRGGVYATPLWAISAWNAVDGYPTHVFFFLNRMVFARFQDLQFSVSEDFENFAARTPGGIVTDDMGISIVAPTQDVIQWLQKGSTVATALAVGTSGEELISGPITTNAPFSPNNRQIDPQGTQGSKAIAALRIANAVLFVQASGKELRKLIFEFYTNSFQSTNLTMLAREIAAAGLVAIDYQKKPDSVVWAIRKANSGRGELIGLTYDPPEVEDGQDVTAWHRHPLGATKAGDASVLSITTLPAPDGTRDELWLLVQRTVDGRLVTHVEYLEKAFDSDDAQSSACFMDSSMQYSGAPVTTLFPLDHLEGETVRVMVDGASHPDCKVTGGKITLNAPASVVQVGLKTAYDLVTLRVEAGSQTGTAQGKLKRITKLNGIRLLNSLGGWFGQYGGPWDEIQYRDTEDRMDAPPALFTGDKTNLSYPGDWERNSRIEIKGDDQFPMCVVALFPELSTTD